MVALRSDHVKVAKLKDRRCLQITGFRVDLLSLGIGEDLGIADGG